MYSDSHFHIWQVSMDSSDGSGPSHHSPFALSLWDILLWSQLPLITQKALQSKGSPSPLLLLHHTLLLGSDIQVPWSLDWSHHLHVTTTALIIMCQCNILHMWSLLSNLQFCSFCPPEHVKSSTSVGRSEEVGITWLQVYGFQLLRCILHLYTK